jgi:hypothetical protein
MAIYVLEKKKITSWFAGRSARYGGGGMGAAPDRAAVT